MKRSRGRGRRQQNPVNRSYDSNGPDVRVRGTAAQIYEKYQTLARDAMASGDRVMAENYQQHGEHYYRILQSLQPQPSETDAQDAAAEAEAPDENGVDADGEAQPLVLSRNGEADDAAGNGAADEAGAAKGSRRRGPLRRRADKTDKADKADKAEKADAAPVELAPSDPVDPGEAEEARPASAE